MIISQNRISVIVPNYNYAKYIKRRLNSILSQTCPIYELIILDDNSTDGSVKILKQEISEIQNNFPNLKIKTIFNSKNSGHVCSQWQKGFEQATGDLVWIAEMDDWAKPDFLKKVTAPMKQNPDIILSYSNSKIVNPEGQIVISRSIRQILESLQNPQLRYPYIHNGKTELIQRLSIYNTIPNVSAVVFRPHQFFIETLQDSTQFKIAGDWYFYSQLLLCGKIAYTPEKLNHYCIHSDSVTKNINHQQYLDETKKMHALISRDVKIPQPTQEKMRQHENYLAKRWNLPN